jgi:hypothetical protein
MSRNNCWEKRTDRYHTAKSQEYRGQFTLHSTEGEGQSQANKAKCPAVCSAPVGSPPRTSETKGLLESAQRLPFYHQQQQQEAYDSEEPGPESPLHTVTTPHGKALASSQGCLAPSKAWAGPLQGLGCNKIYLSTRFCDVRHRKPKQGS